MNPLRHSLLRQRYDWTWHSQALAKVLTQLPGLVQPQTPILLQIGELDGLFLIAGILAGQAAGLRLLNCASDGSQDTLQCLWGIGGVPAGSSQGNFAEAASEAARTHLTERGEPANYLSLLTQIAVSVHQQGLLSSPPGKTLNDHQEELEACLADTNTFVRFNPGIAPDTGLYWLRQPRLEYTPTAERLETALLQLLRAKPNPTPEVVRQTANQSCPGLLTPESELVDAVMAAYADRLPDSQPGWLLRSQEAPQISEKALLELRVILEQLAARLDYSLQSAPNNHGQSFGQRAHSFFAERLCQPGAALIQPHARAEVFRHPRQPFKPGFLPAEAGSKFAAAVRRKLAFCKIPPD